jgi:hypothetical protein
MLDRMMGERSPSWRSMTAASPFTQPMTSTSTQRSSSV